MPVDLRLRRVRDGRGRVRLAPADALSEMALSDLPVKPGRAIKARITIERSGPQNRLAHALFAKVAEGLADPRWTADSVKIALKIRCGLVDVYRMGGREIEVPRSVAFDRMDGSEFSSFLSRAMDVICQEILPGIDRDDLGREIEEMAA